jgi:hypothetical protein
MWLPTWQELRRHRTQSRRFVAALTTIREAHRNRRWMEFANELFEALDGNLDALSWAVSEERLAALIEQGQRIAEESTSREKVRLGARIVAEGVAGKDDWPKVEKANRRRARPRSMRRSGKSRSSSRRTKSLPGFLRYTASSASTGR